MEGGGKGASTLQSPKQHDQGHRGPVGGRAGQREAVGGWMCRWVGGVTCVARQLRICEAETETGEGGYA